METTECPGCDEGTEQFDHMHQYINFLGNVVLVVCIDDQIWYPRDAKPQAPVEYVKATYSVDRKEAFQFLRDIPTIIN